MKYEKLKKFTGKSGFATPWMCELQEYKDYVFAASPVWAVFKKGRLEQPPTNPVAFDELERAFRGILSGSRKLLTDLKRSDLDCVIEQVDDVDKFEECECCNGFGTVTCSCCNKTTECKECRGSGKGQEKITEKPEITYKTELMGIGRYFLHDQLYRFFDLGECLKIYSIHGNTNVLLLNADEYLIILTGCLEPSEGDLPMPINLPEQSS